MVRLVCLAVRGVFLAGLIALCWPAADAHAQSDSATGEKGIVDEVKFGLLAHDVGFLGSHKESGGDVNGEVLFTSPNFLKILFAPRPHIGFDINSSSNTSSLYAGLTWSYTVIPRVLSRKDGIFVEGSVGLAGNDGETDTQNPHRKSLGSPVLFRESLALGWQFSDVLNFSAYLDHISNAGIFKRNEGLTSAGGRFGYKF